MELHRSLSPSSRFIVYQCNKKRPTVDDLFYQQRMKINHVSRLESKPQPELNTASSPLHFVDERFVLFTKMEGDHTHIIKLAEFQLEKKELYDWDFLKIDHVVDWPRGYEIVVNQENTMEHLFAISTNYTETIFILKLENTLDGPRICKSSLDFRHRVPHRLEHRMFDGQKLYGFQWKPAPMGSKLDMTEVVSYDLETKQSEIIKIEGFTKLEFGYKYDHDQEDYSVVLIGCWMKRRFFGVFAPKKFNCYIWNKTKHVIFCMDLDTRKWKPTSFVCNKQISHLSVANNQIIVEASNGLSHFMSTTETYNKDTIYRYRMPIKRPISLQQNAFNVNKRYLAKKPKLAEKFDRFLLPEELRKIEFI